MALHTTVTAINDTSPSTKEIAGINSLRFLAFALVYCSHLLPGFRFGHTGVQFFFVISSFLLTYLSLEEFKQSGSFNRFNFFVRRSLRIYPLYYLVLTFAFFILPVLSNRFSVVVTLPDRKWMYWLFLSNFDYSQHVFFLKLLWSIAVEEQFYLAFLFFSLFFKRFHYQLCLLLFIVYSFYLFLLIEGKFTNEYFNPLSYLPCFISGMLIAKIFFQQKNLLLKTLIAYIIVFAIVGIGLYMFEWNEFFGYLFNTCIYSSLLLLVLLGQNYFALSIQPIFRFFETAGKYTYGLYVYSGLAITLELTVIPIDNPLVAALFVTLVLVAMAVISYHLYEQPFLRLKRYFRKERGRTSQSVAA